MFNIGEDLDKDFSKTIWGKVLLEEIKEDLIDAITSLESARKLLYDNKDLEGYLKIIEADIDMLNNLKANLNNWDNAYEINKVLEFIKWSGKRIDSKEKEEAKNIRDSVKDNLKVLNNVLVCDSKTANRDIF